MTSILINFWAAQLTIAKSKSLYEPLTGDTVDRGMLGILFRRLRNVVSAVLKKETIFL